MRKSFLVSVALHALVLFLLLGGGNGRNGKGMSEGSNDRLIPPSDDSPITVVVADEGYELARKHNARECGKDWYGGIGITMVGNKDEMIVSDVTPGYPAQRAGIEQLDTIYSSQDIRGEIGTKVEVTVKHFKTGLEETVTLTREKICYEEGKKP